MVKNHQSVDWYSYFKSIRQQCPWSYAAYIHGKIAIETWQGQVKPLDEYEARVYIIEQGGEHAEALSTALDYGDDEWLFSYPGYGPWATPVAVIIQQNRQKLKELREKQDASS